MKLVEQFIMENVRIVEADKKKLPEGVLLRVQGLGQRCGVQNANKRTYNKDVWDFVFTNEAWLNKVKSGAMVGEVDHPERNIPSASRASHVRLYIKQASLSACPVAATGRLKMTVLVGSWSRLDICLTLGIASSILQRTVLILHL
jgi:hypothetical protein